MKKYILTYLALISFTFFANAQQVTFYDSQGEARAYIDYDEDDTIFMWDGSPVAFMERDGNHLCIFGFNGSFLGWYEDGIIYDKKGDMVGAIKGAVKMVTKTDRMKSVQNIQTITPVRPILPKSPIQPVLKTTWSNTSLIKFLYYGKQ